MIINKLKTLSKYKISIILISIIFIVFLILNIVLWTTPVYLGTYTYNDSENQIKRKITFYGNTYTISSESYAGGETEEQLWGYSRVYYGFYSYAAAGTSYNITENTIVTASDFDDILDSSNSSDRYIRNSVFSITKSNTEITYICYSAVGLQVFYAIVMVISVVTIIFFTFFEKRRIQST